jgi:autotransporter-associated beta strand protein
MQSKSQIAECSRLGVRRLAALRIVAAAMSVLLAGSLQADTYTWSTQTTGAAVDGSGAWNTAAANWVGAGDVHTVWNNANGDTAAFGAGGTGGVVTASSGITVGGLTFNAVASNTYTVAGGPLALTGAPVITANTNAAVSAALTGAPGLTKTGTGALTLSSVLSSFTGNVTVSQGTLIANAGNNYPSPTNSALGYLQSADRSLAVGSGAALQFNANDTIGNANAFPVVKLSAESGGTIRNASTFTTLGPLNLCGGTLLAVGGVNASFQAYYLKGAVTSGGGSAISTTGGNYNGVHLFDTLFAVTGGTLTVSAPLINKPGGGTSGFSKAGAGAMVLSADNSFSGGVTVSNGVLQVGAGGAAGTLGTGVGAVNLVSDDVALVFNRSGAAAMSGAISGSGSLVKQGAGVVTLSGVNTYAGGTSVSNGVLAATRTNALPGFAEAGRVTLAPGAGLSVGVGSWTDADIGALIATGVYGSDTVFGFDTTAGNYAYSGQFALPTVAGLVKTGPNVLQLAGGTGFEGGVTAWGGILQADFGAGLSASTNVTLSSASLSSASGSLTAALGAGAGQVNLVSGTAFGFSAVDVPLTVNLGGAGAALSWGVAAFNPSVLVLNDTGANTNLTLVNGLSLNGATRTINVNATASGAAAEISGLIANGSGTAGLIKGGSGTLVLSAANTYSGGTTVNAGTLALSGGSNRLNTGGTVTLNSNAALDVGGYSQSLSVAGFVFNGGTLQNGAISLSNASWSPGASANVLIGVGGGIVSPNRLLLNNRQTLTLAPGAGSVCFGGDTGGSANYIGVDNNTTNSIIVNGGSLDFTNSAAGAGYLRIAANAGPPVGTLTVNNGAVNVGHSMSMGARWSNGSDAACTGVATLTLTNGEVTVGTGTGTGTGGGSRGWLYMGNSHAGTVSRSTINLNGGTLSLIQLEAGAYGTHAFNFNGGTLKARANNATLVNGANLTCNVGAGGAVIDTDGYTVGLAANLPGVGSTGGLVKRGLGTLTLSGSNTYSGVTSVEAGTLRLAVRSSLQTTTVTRLSAETLASLKLRLDASDASTLFTNSNGSGAVTASGQPVGYWGDLSGNNKPATQSNTDRRPTYVTGVTEFNGLPVLQFDGADDDITSLLNINASSISNLTVMMVFRQVTYKVNGGLWGHDDGGWDRIQLLNLGGVGLNNIATSGTSVNVPGMNTNSTLIYSAVLKNGVASGSYVYVNGRSDTTNGLPAFTSSEGPGQSLFTVGNISPGNNYRGNIQVGEALVFSTALSDSDRRNAEAYLRDKWLGGPGRFSVAAGAVLDLGGASQALSLVSGDGTVSNGTLTVSNPLSPAGDGIGVQRVSNVALNGVLRVHVTADGACDQLVGTGSLSVSGLTLQVADLGLLNRAETYTVAAGFDSLTDEFAAHNLPENWTLRYNLPAGTAIFHYAPPGTMILVQ